MGRQIVTTLGEWKYLQKQNWGIPFAFDFETTGLSFIKHDVCGLALTFANGNSYYLVFQHTDPQDVLVEEYQEREELDGYDEEEYFTPKKQLRKTRQVPRYKTVGETVVVSKTIYPAKQYIDPKRAADMLNPLFDQDVLKVAHNEKFDLHFLDKVGIRINDQDADTMLAAKLIDENRLVGLKQLAPMVYMDLTEYQQLPHYPGFHKDEFLGVPLEEAATYAMMDTEATLKLWKLFEEELEYEGVAQAFRFIWMPAMRVLQKMEHRGIAVDLEKVHALKVKYEAERADADQRIMQIGMEMVNARYTALTAPPNFLRMLTPTEAEQYNAQDAAEALIQTDEGFTTLAFKPTPRSAPRALTFNPGSNDHLAVLFYDHLKLKIPSKVKVSRTNGGRPVDKNMLKIWQNELGKDCPPIIADILHRREADKFVTTYLDRLLHEADPNDHNAVRTTFNMHVADTGRLSSSNPLNLQNIPSREQRGKEARELFIARPGYQLVVADYSNMELVMASNFAAENYPNHEMLVALRDGIDLHSLTASRQFDIDYQKFIDAVANDDPDAKLKRLVAKILNFSNMYGIGAKKLQVFIWTETGVYYELPVVQRFLDAFDQTYSGITKWKRDEIKQLHELGYITTIGGRKRRLPQIRSHDRYEVMRAERQGVNAKVQGSCADIMLGAMPRIQRYLEKLGATLLLQVHDELVGESPIEYVEEAKKIIELGMVGHINPYLTLPLKATAHAGHSWAEAK